MLRNTCQGMFAKKMLRILHFHAFQDSGWQKWLRHAFWADDKVKTSYYYLGGGVKFETSFVENEDIFPLVLLTVSSLAKCSVQLCIIYWFHRILLRLVLSVQNWIAAMGAHHPTSLTISYDEAIGSAVAKVFPQTYHLYCNSQILNICKENLANLYYGSASFEEIWSVH